MSNETKGCPSGPDNCPLSDEVVDRAVKKVFAIIGVDVDKPESVDEFRENLWFGKRLRKIGEHSMLALFAVVMAGIAAAVWAGIVAKLSGR